MKQSELKQLKFDSEHNKLKRKNCAVHLTKFLYDNNNINVISVNSKWGTGKTWFTNMWINYITESEYTDKIIPVYYNAWENDDFENAFVPIMAEIDEKLFSVKNTAANNTAANKILENIKKAAGAIIKTSAINLVKKVTVDIVDLEGGLKKIKDVDIYKEQIREFAELRHARKNFIESLNNYIKEAGTPSRIFIFIDELDRCRPTFAIETLERIKHYFNVDGFQFILIMDSSQLSHSIKVLYGNGCDTLGYLRRFIDVEFNMPESDTELYLKKRPDYEKLPFWVTNVAKEFNLSLRDWDKLELWFDALSSTPKCKINYDIGVMFYLYGYLLVLKLKNPELYNDFFINPEYENFPNVQNVDKIIYKAYNIRLIKITLFLINGKDFTTEKWDGGLSEDENSIIENYNKPLNPRSSYKRQFKEAWENINFLSKFT